jgi:hypothetical protein
MDEGSDYMKIEVRTWIQRYLQRARTNSIRRNDINQDFQSPRHGRVARKKVTSHWQQQVHGDTLREVRLEYHRPGARFTCGLLIPTVTPRNGPKILQSDTTRHITSFTPRNTQLFPNHAPPPLKNHISHLTSSTTSPRTNSILLTLSTLSLYFPTTKYLVATSHPSACHSAASQAIPKKI